MLQSKTKQIIHYVGCVTLGKQDQYERLIRTKEYYLKFINSKVHSINLRCWSVVIEDPDLNICLVLEDVIYFTECARVTIIVLF